jgi:hypothetical protein
MEVGTEVNVEPDPERVAEVDITCGQTDITSVDDVKVEGMDVYLFLFAGCGFMRKTRSVGQRLFLCLGGVNDTWLAFSTNHPPGGEDAFDHVHRFEDDSSSQGIHHLCFAEKLMDQMEMIAEPVPPDIHRREFVLLWLNIIKAFKFLCISLARYFSGGEGTGLVQWLDEG